MNIKLLSEKINLSNISRASIAESLGITRQGLFNKLSGVREFKSSEIMKLSMLLELTPEEKEAIFLLIM